MMKKRVKLDYPTKSTAMLAIKRNQLGHHPHTITMNRRGMYFRFEPVFYVEDPESRKEIKKLGFSVTLPIPE